MFIHPRAGQISSSYSNYRIIVAGTLATLRVSKAGTYDEGIYYCIFNLIGGGPETVHQSVKLEYRNTTVIDTRFTRCVCVCVCVVCVCVCVCVCA